MYTYMFVYYFFCLTLNVCLLKFGKLFIKFIYNLITNKSQSKRSVYVDVQQELAWNGPFGTPEVIIVQVLGDGTFTLKQ